MIVAQQPMHEAPNGRLHADVAIFTAWCSDVGVANPCETQAIKLAVPYRFPSF